MEIDAPEAEGLQKLRVVVDSGTGECAMDPDMAPGNEVVEIEASRRGAHYRGPGGEKIYKKGQQRIGMMLRGGLTSRMTFNSAKVRKPLLAVSSIADKGNCTVFGPKGAWIIPAGAAGLDELLAFVEAIVGKIGLTRENGVYHLPAWLIPHSPKPPFHRRGA